jgi:hypothetical protein
VQCIFVWCHLCGSAADGAWEGEGSYKTGDEMFSVTSRKESRKTREGVEAIAGKYAVKDLCILSEFCRPVTDESCRSFPLHGVYFVCAPGMFLRVELVCTYRIAMLLESFSSFFGIPELW